MIAGRDSDQTRPSRPPCFPPQSFLDLALRLPHASSCSLSELSAASAKDLSTFSVLVCKS